MLDNVYEHMWLAWAIENLKFIEGTKTLISAGLGEGLTVQPLSSLEHIEDDSWQIFENMGGKILGYNSCPCSIFLDLRMYIGLCAFRDSKVEDDWTLECPEICTHIVEC